MSKNNLFYSIYMLISIFVIFSCNQKYDEKNAEFIVYSKKINSYNNLYATVYVSDADWVEMAEFADSMVREHSFLSNILFYNDSTNTPVLSDALLAFDKSVESIATYVIPLSNRIADEGKIIDSTIDLSFKLFANNGKVIELDNPYNADYRDANAYVVFHNNYYDYDKQTQETASRFINLMLESNLDKLSNLFIGEIDEEQVQNINELLLSTEWDKVRKSEGGSAEKYNLWYVQRSFVKDMDTLKIKIHFDVNKAADKIESVEYSYVE